MNIRKTSLVVLTALTLACRSTVAAELVDLRCDYRVNPLAVEQHMPELSWRIATDQEGAAQSAYRIQAATSKDALPNADLWDSSWVDSTETTHIRYQGDQIPETTRVWWRVRVKDETGKFSKWSSPTWFETGLRDESGWNNAHWISCTREVKPQFAPKELMGPWIGIADNTAVTPELMPGFRTEFTLPNTPVVYAGAWWGSTKPATLRCTVNGTDAEYVRKAGAPKFTDFSFHLQPGENRIQVQFTRARFDCAIAFGMQVVLADGTQRIIKSSAKWRMVFGQEDERPVRVVCAYGDKPNGEAEVYSRAPLAATWFKKDFVIDKAVTAARLYICGLGYSEAFLNGKKVGDHVLDPGQTDYEETAHYQAFDVSRQVRMGTNVLAILLGDGWYNQDRGFCTTTLAYGKPGLRTLLTLLFADGSRQLVTSDADWMWKESGTRLSNVYLGDHVDFRQEHDEWQVPGFPSGWQASREVPPLSPRLTAQDFPPIRKIRMIAPVRQWQTGERTWVFDLGQNISGWIRLKFNEPDGTVLRVRCTEMLMPDGTHLANVPTSFWWCHGAPQHHTLLCDGQPRTWEPRFSYHGFRYFEVHGLSHAPRDGDIAGVVIHTDVPVTATFESADPFLDRVFQMGVQTHLNNMHSILEDCPHREKCMWGGDLHSSWSTGFYALDATTFYRQLVNLYYTPPFAPNGLPGRVGVGKRITTHSRADFSWSVSPLFLAWRLYQIDGDLDTTRAHYPRMLHFLQYFENNAPGLIPKQAAHGDHSAPPDIERTEQDKNLIAAMNFFAAAERFGELAEALMRHDDAAWARKLAQRIRTSILAKYYNANQNTFGNGTHDSLALAFGLPERKYRQAVAVSFARIYRDNGGKFDGGFMSYHIYPQLAENGEVDLALNMLRSPDYPGLAWSIANYDATTIWEIFCLDPVLRADRSLNHHAMNHPSAWLITHLAGIQADANRPGFRHIRLVPYTPNHLDWVRATLKTPHGTILSHWEQQDGVVQWKVVIPPNCQATLQIPEPGRDFKINGKPFKRKASKIRRAAGAYSLTWRR